MTSKAASNPIPEGIDGVRMMRNMGECDIPVESQKLNTQLAAFLKLEGDHEVVEKALGKGLFAGLRMDTHCKKNLNVRIAVKFDSDEKLTDITRELKEKEDQAIALQKQLQAVAEDAQKLLAERWSYSVKNYGLNPDKNFYRLLEEEGIIEEVELRCDKCTAGKSMIDARLEVEEYLTKLPKEENNDGPPKRNGIDTPEGHAAQVGETSSPK